MHVLTMHVTGLLTCVHAVMCSDYCTCSKYLICVKMQHFKLVISNDASLSGNSFPIVASYGLTGFKSGPSSLMYKAKAHS